MSSEVKANKLSPATGTDVTLGDASDTFTIPASATIQVASSGEIDIASGATLDVNGTLDVTGATVTGLSAGITAASQWRVTTSFTGDATPISTNWEEVDAPVGFGILGSSMTESSGIFTFPSTGYWFIGFTLSAYASSGAGNVIDGWIYTTTDDSTYAQAARPRLSLAGSNYVNTAFGTFIQDVTDTSNDKVAFYVEGNFGTVQGNTDDNTTCVTFIRLGDT